MLSDIFINSKNELAEMGNIDQARAVSSKFVNEIRSATYGSYPLVMANNDEIIFYSPIGASAENVNRIRYYVTDSILYKGVITPVNGIYNPATEVITPVLNNLLNGTDPVFYYYDGSYDNAENTTPMVQPVNVNQVKFVKINLKIQSQMTKQSTSIFSLSVGGAIRVLKNNFND